MIRIFGMVKPALQLREHRLRAGSSVFIPGNVWHGARNTGTNVLRLLYVFATDSFADVYYEFANDQEPVGP